MAVIVLSWAALCPSVCAGGTASESESTVIDRHFLSDIEAAFKEEKKTGKDMSLTYIGIWQKHEDELIYLARKGDKKAIEVGIALIAQNDKNYNWRLWEQLAGPLFEYHEKTFWEALDKQDSEIQMRALGVCDICQPNGWSWSLGNHLGEHPDINKAYLKRYGLSAQPGTMPESITINTKFLYQLQRALDQEKQSGESRTSPCMELWERHSDDLYYLVERGDRRAIEVGISLLGRGEHPGCECVSDDYDRLIVPIFEADDRFFWDTLAKKSPDAQLNVLRLGNEYGPEDWDSDAYLAKHPKLRKLYKARYGEEPNSVPGWISLRRSEYVPADCRVTGILIYYSGDLKGRLDYMVGSVRYIGDCMDKRFKPVTVVDNYRAIDEISALYAEALNGAKADAKSSGGKPKSKIVFIADHVAYVRDFSIGDGDIHDSVMSSPKLYQAFKKYGLLPKPSAKSAPAASSVR